MRDNHQGYIEIRDAYEHEGLFFGVVRLTISSKTATFEFGVEQRGYLTLRKILQARPFDATPGVKCRYFFTGGYSTQFEKIAIQVRVEQGNQGKAFEFDSPRSLVSNLLWFDGLSNFREAAALKQVPE